MIDREKVIESLYWVINDIEENGHYQIDYYADEIQANIIKRHYGIKKGW